jgi:hypothetical protein
MDLFLGTVEMEAKTLPGRPKINSLFRTATACGRSVLRFLGIVGNDDLSVVIL